MKKLVLLSMLLTSGIGFAQTDTVAVEVDSSNVNAKNSGYQMCGFAQNLANQKHPKYTIKSYFDYFANSNVISNSFVNTFLFEDFIENSVKDDVTNLMNSKINRFGVDVDAGLEFKIHPNRSHFKNNDELTFFDKSTKIFRVGQRDFTSLKFTDNFFELYFRGNKQFAGESITLGPVDYTNFSYQYFGYGLEYDISKKETIGAIINILKGTRFTDVNMPTAQLFTAQDGDSINFAADINLAKADNLQPRLSSFQGFGTSFDLLYKKKTDAITYELKIEDLGFISWFGLNSFQANSEWAFTGVEINDILNINGNEFNNVQADSLSNILGIKNQVSNKFYLLPTKLQAEITYNRIRPLSFNLGARYYLSTANLPRIWLKTAYNCCHSSRIQPSLTLAYGGFSKFDAAIGLDWSTYNFDLALQAFYIEPIVSSAQTTGQGVSISLAYKIR